MAASNRSTPRRSTLATPHGAEPLSPVHHHHHHYATGTHVINNYTPHDSPRTPIRSAATHAQAVQATRDINNDYEPAQPTNLLTHLHTLAIPIHSSVTPPANTSSQRTPGSYFPPTPSATMVPAPPYTPVRPSHYTDPRIVNTRPIPPPRITTIDGESIIDIISNDTKILSLGRAVLTQPSRLGGHPESHHSWLIRHPDTRRYHTEQAWDNICAQSLACDLFTDTVTMVFQVRPTLPPGINTIDPSSCTLKVLSNTTRAHVIDPSYMSSLTEVIGSMLRHSIGARHAASFGYRCGFSDARPIPIVNTRSMFVIPQANSLVPSSRKDWQQQKGGSPPHLTRLTSALNDVGVPTPAAQAIYRIVTNNSPGFAAPETWMADFRGVVPVLNHLQAAILVVAAIEDCVAVGWPLE
ncbi:hypothetical protein BKA62DRAFT_675161 [Auriculariales sp. MPI-PUGE-AT-0066]|nr:hypothetical protein BKA62DRAFT_675161 [Auriculariales sp. MPI-PUGE-AT-0066]